jgi:hypothetical protein
MAHVVPDLVDDARELGLAHGHGRIRQVQAPRPLAAELDRQRRGNRLPGVSLDSS